MNRTELNEYLKQQVAVVNNHVDYMKEATYDCIAERRAQCTVK